MEEKTTFFDPLLERAEAYGKVNFELYKLKLVEKSAGVVSTLVSRALAFSLFGLFILFMSAGVAWWLGDVLGKTYYGILCVAGLYLLTGLVVYYVLHRRIRTRVANALISEMLN
ncbi:MAG TPA: hypothetical protein VFX48_04180 [Saprospiraceae bacterium]|nr:hypothetical protein [Saprospiraceae bacterium]